MKRRVGILMCCLAVIGMFSVSVLSVQAAACTHEHYFLNAGASYDYINENGHYTATGNKWVCASCGQDSYWTDVYTEKVGDHNYNDDGVCTICFYKK